MTERSQKREPEITYEDVAKHFAPLRHRDLTQDEKEKGVLVPLERIQMEALNDPTDPVAALADSIHRSRVESRRS